MEDQEEVFEVERIEHIRTRKGQKEYLIKWKGYGESENSWEPASSFEEGLDSALAKYLQRRESEQRRKSRSSYSRKGRNTPSRKKIASTKKASASSTKRKKTVPAIGTRRSARLSKRQKNAIEDVDNERVRAGIRELKAALDEAYEEGEEGSKTPEHDATTEDTENTEKADVPVSNFGWASISSICPIS